MEEERHKLVAVLVLRRLEVVLRKLVGELHRLVEEHRKLVEEHRKLEVVLRRLGELQVVDILVVEHLAVVHIVVVGPGMLVNLLGTHLVDADLHDRNGAQPSPR